MATFIDGIAASENIDSSGERISIAGMDISSLALDGVFTYEHEAATGPKGEKITVKMPEQTVGKILKANKIFSEKDCTDERQKYFWDKCQTPFIYIMGELFDDYTAAARDLAGKFRYDQDRLNQNERTVMNFSIEGAYIAKEGIEVTRSVARKCTITVLPCNKAARAEMIPAQGSAKGKNNIESLFKTEFVEIELFKAEELKFFPAPIASDMQKHADALGIAPMKKSIPKDPAAPSAPKLPSLTTKAGTSIGQTKSGKTIMSHAKIHEYQGFHSQDHQDAANLHHGAAQAATTPVAGRHHLDKMKLHLQAARTHEQRETRVSRVIGDRKNIDNLKFKQTIGKAETAGSGMAAPSQLTGTAALTKEDLHKSDNHFYFKGDKCRHTGKKTTAHGGEFHEFEYLEGHKKGQLGHTSKGPGEDQTVQATKSPKIKTPQIAPMKKSEWLDRANEEYANWGKREEFQAFMAERMPHLAQGEVDAIGRTLALKKSVDAETSLSKLVKKK